MQPPGIPGGEGGVLCGFAPRVGCRPHWKHLDIDFDGVLPVVAMGDFSLLMSQDFLDKGRIVARKRHS